jgi:hypothetical protein
MRASYLAFAAISYKVAIKLREDYAGAKSSGLRRSEVMKKDGSQGTAFFLLIRQSQNVERSFRTMSDIIRPIGTFVDRKLTRDGEYLYEWLLTMYNYSNEQNKKSYSL